MARRLVLSIAGYDVLTACSGDAALEMLGSHPVELVITDHFLPGFPGAEIMVAMKQTKPEVPVVLLTSTPVLPPGAELADMVLIKGIPPPEFLAAIAKLVEQQGSAGIDPQSDGGSR
jgi:CheY-like chemotaxis protein